MKNKKSIYLLLPVVLLIWGLVIYQFFSFSNEPAPNAEEQNYSLETLKIKERDTIPIVVNYRDPFLGKMYGPHQKTVGVKKTKRPVKETPPLVWPAIIYKGIVSDTKNEKKVFMLIINGRTFLMKKGSTENEILLIDGTKESVSVKYQGAKNVIPIKR